MIEGFIFMSMREIILKFLTESASSEINQLYEYLTMSDEEKAIDMAYLQPYFFDEWYGNNKNDMSDEYRSFLDNIDEEYEAIDYFQSKGDNKSIVKYGQWLIDNKLNSREVMDVEKPTWLCFESPVKYDGWIIHFTNYARDIELQGFTHGTMDMTKLCLTTHMTHDSKYSGGYNFGYTLQDSPQMSSSYGSQIILLRANAVRGYHYWDEEYQTIFWGENVKYITRLPSDLYYEDNEGNEVEFMSIKDMAEYYIENRLYNE